MRDAVGDVQSLLVLGGTSEIALATARKLAGGRTRKVILAARDPAGAEAAADELRRAGAEVATVAFDALDLESHAGFVRQVFDDHGDIDCVLVAFGVLGAQEDYERDGLAAARAVQVNFTGAVSVTMPLVERLRAQGHGVVVFLSSVAAERARKSNYVYGSTKAGLDAFAQGLGDSLQGTGVEVMVVRPGFVRTKMTAGLEEAPMTVEPGKVADAIVAGLRRRSHTVWAPAPLRVVFSVLRHLPRALFKRLDI